MQLSHFLTSALIVGASAAPAAESNLDARGGKCKKTTVRREWRAMSQSDRLKYISAMQCFQSTAGETTSTYAGAVSRFDDFQALHIAQTDYTHWVGFFLPWHRYFLYLFENALREDCNYYGGIPYWDWTQDATSESSFLASPVFDPVYGFGGNGPYIEDLSVFPPEWLLAADIPGRTGGGCVEDGVFASRNVSMGPGNSTVYTPHCLRRDFSPSLATATLNSDMEAWVRNGEDFFEFTHRTEALTLATEDMTVHAGGHISVGGKIGDLSNTYSSPGDPLFYLHHSALDRMWYRWQKADWPARKYDMGGPDTQWGYPYNYWGDIPYANVTLDFVMHFDLLGGDHTIRETMDIGDLCYTYA